MTIDVAPYRAFWRQLAQAEPTPEMRAAAEAAREEARRLAQILADEFGVTRVYLFGSFAWGVETRPDSDLDLAVEGLPPEQFFLAYSRLMDASRYEVDLKPLENLFSRLHNRVLQSGLVVYERQPKVAVE